MNDLEKLIQTQIRAHGAISFARFMELALYCPESGYYDRFANTVGKAGDYFTNVSVGAVFGELLADQFVAWLNQLEAPRLQIVEAGAHDGRLAVDILGTLSCRNSCTFTRTEYWILEPSTRQRQRQVENLRAFSGRVRWFDSWSSVPAGGVRGVIFSNELLDALPVHRVVWNAQAQTWSEWGVGLREDRLTWARLPMAANVEAALRHLGLPGELQSVLPDGFTTEICLAAIGWWRMAAAALTKGRLLAIDYGLRGPEFFVPERSNGTLRAYSRHRLSNDLLSNIGEQDLTAHVNFSAIQHTGETEGLTTDAFMTQAEFLTRVAEGRKSNTPWSANQIRAFQTLTHPDHLGTRFRVLIQSR